MKRSSVRWIVGAVIAVIAFVVTASAIDFAGMTTLEARLTQLARERSRELWLTGERQATLRRLRANDGIDFYPARSSASFDQTCFPVPQQEVDNNTNSLLFPNQ